MRRFLALAAAIVILPVAGGVNAGNAASPTPAHSTHAIQAKPAIAVGATLDTQGRLWLAREDGGQIYVSRSDDNGKTFSAALPVLAQPEAVVADSESRPLLRVLVFSCINIHC